MIIKSFDFQLMDAKMYVIREGDEAVVIDPCVNDDAFAYLSGVEKVTIMLTHEHFDHISGVNEFRDRFDCEVISSEVCNEIMSKKAANTRTFPFLFLNDVEKFHYIRENYKLPYFCSATQTFTGELGIKAAGHDFELYEMPGHSPGSTVILMDGSILFAGDNLIGNGNEVIFHDSDKTFYKERVVPFFDSPKCTGVKVMPGHGLPDTMEHFLEIIHGYTY